MVSSYSQEQGSYHYVHGMEKVLNSASLLHWWCWSSTSKDGEVHTEVWFLLCDLLWPDLCSRNYIHRSSKVI